MGHEQHQRQEGHRPLPVHLDRRLQVDQAGPVAGREPPANRPGAAIGVADRLAGLDRRRLGSAAGGPHLGGARRIDPPRPSIDDVADQRPGVRGRRPHAVDLEGEAFGRHRDRERPRLEPGCTGCVEDCVAGPVGGRQRGGRLELDLLDQGRAGAAWRIDPQANARPECRQHHPHGVPDSGPHGKPDRLFLAGVLAEVEDLHHPVGSRLDDERHPQR